MRTHLIILLITTLVFTLYFNIGFLIPKPSETFDLPVDESLRKEALHRGLSPVPSSWDRALQVVDDSDNPLSSKKIALGHRLFFDPVLSKDRTLSCASCHILEAGGDDNRPTAIGYHNQPNPKHLNSPTVLNAALAKRQFWDGRSPSVEDQAKGPIQAPFEMAMSPKKVVERLKRRDDYVEAFANVFPKKGITFDTVTKAIGAFERTLLTRGAFDLFLEGDDDAISDEAKAGLYLFMRIGCKGCHTGMSVGGQSLQHFPLRRYNSILAPESRFVNGARYFAGFSWQKPRGDAAFPFSDIGEFHGRNGQFVFRVPILRNVTRTAPYFHNGSIETIEEAVRIMARHQLGLTLTNDQIDQIVAFLKTLEGKPVDYVVR
ncbi:cytochrome-c peroxidase [Hydrogenimonas cancrithermarum]|uniref:Cytochrome c biogenesis protein CcsA n=1 Tax=Hydrogenimonas cancrithermarum TaxID=2993563 RepID=A0ABN6WZ63_9BACT|nr:cytochrome c peroxidase [Hydrogenimonas cancrithermarum]BDY13649.1 cytochrome c biogenesis protein CcsA [Hydrogenimonas cancrithermarum]